MKEPGEPTKSDTVAAEVTAGRSDPENAQISAMLEKSKKEGEKRRKRITRTCVVTGIFGACLGVLVHRLPFIMYPELGLRALGEPPVFIGLGMIFVSASILLLGVLPTDLMAIKVANRILCGFVFLFSLLATVIIYAWIKDGSYWRMRRAYWLSAINVYTVICLARIIRASYLTQRERLDRLWRVLSQWLLGLGIGFAVGPRLSFSPEERTMATKSGWGMSINVYLFAAIITINGAVCFAPNFRVRAQAFLSRQGETRSLAAAVAAAIGNHSVEETQQKAAKLLRYVTLDKISKEELAENKPNPLLYERSVLGRFGDVDAFISHSWTDPSDDKWEGLQGWRARFKARHGREPRVWFDKCCINQRDIDDSLMCLPVHLAACKQILMLVGPSYLTRLWCIMEIFVFFAAVDDPTRLECIALRESTEATSPKAKAEEDVKESFRTFCVNKCMCHGAATRDKLLSIIEAGCGTLEGFDTLIQNVQLPFGEDVSSPRGQKTSMGMSWMAKSSVPTSDAIVSPDAIHADVTAPGA
jgi:hypothetical protein